MWIPENLDPDGPRYLAVVKALEDDIAHGRAHDGMALATQRELAYQLGLSVGTVVRAYTIAQQRGLIVREVGRGTFVSTANAHAETRFFGDGSAHEDARAIGMVDLSVNVPPALPQADRIGNALRNLANAPELPAMLRYGAHLGAENHRQTLADWIAQASAGRYAPSSDRLAVCIGAQQAMWAICTAVTAPGETILTENLTFAGIKSIAGLLGANIHGVEMDEFGLIPEALEEACAKTSASVLYTMPTVQNPTGATMPEDRRRAIAAIAEKHGLIVIEDDVYGFLSPDAPSPLAALLPEQVCYVSSFSKSVAPGLRVGFAVLPDPLTRRVEAAIRASCWMGPTLMTEAVCQLIRHGHLDDIVVQRRQEARQRLDAASGVLSAIAARMNWKEDRFHLWLPTRDWTEAEQIVRRARDAGVLLSAPDAVAAGPSSPSGIRLCLGSAPDTGTLLTALKKVRTAFEETAAGIETHATI